MGTKENILALRAQTGAGVIACRKALEEAGGDVPRALDILKRKGSLAAAAKAGRSVTQGLIGTYLHTGGTVAAMVLLRCETDFVARNPAFVELARDLAMQVAAMNPLVIRPEDAPVGAEPTTAALLAQTFIKDTDGRQTVRELLDAKVLELGENITVEQFARFAV